MKNSSFKLKPDCKYYVHTNHAITACIVDPDHPHIFETYDKCVDCRDYESSNKSKEKGEK